MILLLAFSSIAFPCTWFIYDDYSDGSTDGRQVGGTFVPGGWRPDGGTIVYDLPVVVAGTITMRISNIDEAGVSQHDLLELFSGVDGSFSDHRRDNFLQVKFAGDVYDGYDGRVKLQAGPEWYGDYEIGAWTSEYDWDPNASYDFTVAWGGTTAALDVAGALSTSIDYGYYGELGFQTLRIPNNGSYTRDGLMDDIIIAGVSLCGDEGVGGGDTGIGTDSGTPGDTGGGTDGGSPGDTGDTPGVDTGSGSGADGGGSDAPVVTTFTLQPQEVLAGEAWTLQWVIAGELYGATFCLRPDGANTETCTSLAGDAGHATIPSEGLVTGAYVGQVFANGPGGAAASTPIDVRVAVTPVRRGQTGCGCQAPAPGATMAGLLAVLSCVGVRRRR